MSCTADKAWEAIVTPILTRDLQQRYGGVIRNAGVSEDRFHGTDFFWNRQEKTYRLACRVRTRDFLRYRGEFTIREDRPQSHQKTELEKIRVGDWADVYAYAFSDGQRILHWSLFRMSRFNPDAPFQYMRGFGPGDKQDTVTRIYSLSAQPDGFLIDTAPPRAIPVQLDYERKAS